MLGWALIINNLGRRRYPIYWWAAGKTFVSAKPLANEKERQRELREVEDGLQSTEGPVFDSAGDEGEGAGGNREYGHGDRGGDLATNGAA